jgi:integrase
MVHVVRPGRIGVRDKALLLLGFAGAFRRSELVSLDVSDITLDPAGLAVILRRSKTDQLAAGRKVGIPYGEHRATCAVLAVRAWLKISGVAEGPLFRKVPQRGPVGGERLSGLAVARVVKLVAQAAGLDASSFSGHSLRSGFATSAAGAGKSERAIMRHTGHRTVEAVRRYIREAGVFSESAAEGIGL